VSDTDDVENLCEAAPPCIQPDQLQRIAELPPGRYELVIEGTFTGAVPVSCFSEVFVFDVDGDVTLGTLAVPFDDSADPAFCNRL